MKYLIIVLYCLVLVGCENSFNKKLESTIEKIERLETTQRLLIWTYGYDSKMNFFVINTLLKKGIISFEELTQEQNRIFSQLY